jgi:hypothetical protein
MWVPHALDLVLFISVRFKNKSIGEDLFLDTKSEICFRSLISQKSLTSTKPTYDRSARKKKRKKKTVRSIVSTGITYATTREK